MRLAKCPGNLGFAEPSPEDVACPNCGTQVEIWSDEASGRCPSCGKLVIRTDTQSCVDWCRYARECLGEEGYREYGNMKTAIRKAALWQALDEHCPADDAWKAFAETALRFAEQFCSRNESTDPLSVVAAIILLSLHDVPIETLLSRLRRKTAPAMPASNPTERHDSEANVKTILEQLNTAGSVCKHVLAIQQALLKTDASAQIKENIDYQLVHDAFLLAALEAPMPSNARPQANDVFRACLSEEGRALALEMRRSGQGAPA